MLDGVRVNEKVPRLYWDMGWFISNKIGRDDEAKYYRRLFAGKKDVRSRAPTSAIRPPPPTTPNTTTPRTTSRTSKAALRAAHRLSPQHVRRRARQLARGQGLVHGFGEQDQSAPLSGKGMADVIFYSDAPLCQFYYADNLEKDGYFNQKAANAWKQATREWHDFGEKAIDTSWDVKVQLNREEELEAKVARNVTALDALVPGEREKLKKEKYASLTPERREAWDSDPAKRIAAAGKARDGDHRSHGGEGRRGGPPRRPGQQGKRPRSWLSRSRPTARWRLTPSASGKR